jgi:hypothetical protein
VLLAEKHYEECNGLEMTDAVRVTIAGEAALLILSRETKYYPELLSILVYPDVFYADVEDSEGHIVSEYKEDRSGESWDMGVIILSWEDAVKHASTVAGIQRRVARVRAPARHGKRRHGRHSAAGYARAARNGSACSARRTTISSAKSSGTVSWTNTHPVIRRSSSRW